MIGGLLLCNEAHHLACHFVPVHLRAALLQEQDMYLQSIEHMWLA